MFKKLKEISDTTVFLMLSIICVLYVNTVSSSQHLIELAILKLSDPSFFPYDPVINSYAENPLNNFAVLFLSLYQKLFFFDTKFFFINFFVKTLTLFGIYKIYQFFMLNRLFCLIGSLLHLSPSILVLPYIGDWYIISPALHTNSIFLLCFVYFIYSLLNKKYMLAITLQIFGIVAHPPLGLFLALPTLLLFCSCQAFKEKDIFIKHVSGKYSYFMMVISVIVNSLYLAKLAALNTSDLIAEEFINIYFLHAPHHYQVSTFSIIEIFWPYFFIICGYIGVIKYEKRSSLRLFLLMLCPLIIFSIPLHYIFTEVLPSIYILSLHITRSASILSLALLAPFFFKLILPKNIWGVSSNDV